MLKVQAPTQAINFAAGKVLNSQILDCMQRPVNLHVNQFCCVILVLCDVVQFCKGRTIANCDAFDSSARSIRGCYGAQCVHLNHRMHPCL